MNALQVPDCYPLLTSSWPGVQGDSLILPEGGDDPHIERVIHYLGVVVGLFPIRWYLPRCAVTALVGVVIEMATSSR
jgi:hypothetical protein